MSVITPLKNKISLHVDQIIDALACDGFAISDGVFPNSLIEETFLYAQGLHGSFAAAKIGKGLSQKKSKLIRGDKILWIEDFSRAPLHAYAEFFGLMQQSLRRELFLPIVRFESHLASYEPGSFYRWHVDRHRQNLRRIISCVIYLSDWKEGDGGHLEIEKNTNSELVRIAPKKGRLVVFDSRLRHQVCEVNAQRWSLTSWFRDDQEVLA